jgi:intraflagellar transport protein 56
MKGPTCALKNRILFNISHRLADETRLMDYHHNLKDDKFDQLCLAGVHYLRSHYQVGR